MDPSLLKICSGFMIPGRALNQPTFSFTQWAREDINAPIVHICAPCAHTCFGFDPKSGKRHPDIDILDDTRELKKPFVCGCKTLKKTGHKCYWADCHRSSVLSSSSNEEVEETILPLIENGWRKEARAFLEDMSYNSDMDDAYTTRDNAKEIEKFTKNLRSQQDSFDQYFEEDNQAAARRAMPITKLIQRAKLAYKNEKKEKAQRNNNNNNNNLSPEEEMENDDEEDGNNNNIYKALADPNLHDHILKQLLHWFKNDFFTWVTSPLCEKCGEKTVTYRPTSRESVVPTPEEKQNLASVIELYTCKNCQKNGEEEKIIRFPRYNKAKRLLTWRKGRCGEWTNCFCLLLVTLGFETRYVLDLTDHVWAEVFSSSRGRWIHLDPCENAFDAPLMYSKGWGKKLNYIFAISQTEIVDVTRRYTENPLALETRNRVSELSLSHLVRGMNWFANKRCPLTKLALLEQRAAREREELSHAGGDIIHGEDTSGATNKGRQSGKGSWTLSRNEHGGGAAEGGMTTAARGFLSSYSTSSKNSSGIGQTSASQNGMSTLDSISSHAATLFLMSDEERRERIQRGSTNVVRLFDEVNLDSNNNNNNNSMIAPRPKWIWKGGKQNVIQLFKATEEEKSSSGWFSFRFASGSGGSCQFIMSPPDNDSSNSSTSPQQSCALPSWTTHSSSNLPANAQSNPTQLFPYPTPQMLNSPRLPVPFSAERFQTVVDEFCASLWFVPYFCTPSSDAKEDGTTNKTQMNNNNRRGIIGFSVGKTFRVDVSWDFRIDNTNDEKNKSNQEKKEGELTLALSIRHVDLPTMSSPEQQQLQKTKKWSENFTSVEPIGIWDKQSKAHVSSSSSNSKRRVVFEKVTIAEGDKKKEEATSSLFVLKSSCAIQLFASVDKQGAVTANVYQKSLVGEGNENNNNTSPKEDEEEMTLTSCATTGSMIPLFLMDRGPVSMKVHGLETLLESAQVGW